jgi:hypothetical protein
VFFDTLVHALSVRVDHDGFFLVDTIKALAMDRGVHQEGFGVFPDLTGVTYLSVKVQTMGAIRLDTIRPVVRVLTKQPVG